MGTYGIAQIKAIYGLRTQRDDMALQKDSEGFWINPGASMPGGWQGNYALENARKLAYILQNQYGWTIDAISAWFSAISYESAFDPSKIEGNLLSPTKNSGVGYVQWTPSDNLIRFCNEWGVDWKLTSSQCRKWELERTTTDSNIKQWFVMSPYIDLYSQYFTRAPCQTMNDFTHATLSQYSMLELCAMIPEFYTRPASWANVDNWHRNEAAGNYWYTQLTGENPPQPPDPGPGPGPITTHKKFFMYLGRRKL